MNANFPKEGFNNYYKNGFGGDAYLKFLFLRRHLSLGAKVGYLKFPSKNNSTDLNYTEIALLPVKGNFEIYLLTRGIKPFIGIDFGYYNFNVGQKDQQGNTRYHQKGYLGYAPLIGIGFGLLEHLDLNITGRMERIYSSDQNDQAVQEFKNLMYFDVLVGASFTF